MQLRPIRDNRARHALRISAGLLFVVAVIAVGGRIAASNSGDGATADDGGGADYAPRIARQAPAAAAAELPSLPAHLVSAPERPAAGPIDLITPLPYAASADARSVALDAYRAAARQWPAMGCRGRWSILAAIGHVESSHGQAAGPVAVVGDDGDITPEILGPVLDGGDYALVVDTDGGRLDGDTSFDRAVGPMQFMPATWGDHQRDGNGDGVADPNNLYDASLAAASYLCSARTGNLDDEATLRVALHAYNQSEEYVLRVLDLADWYATGRMGTRTTGGTDGAPAPEPTKLFDLDPAVLTAGAGEEELDIASTGSAPAAPAETSSPAPEPSPTTTTTPATTTTTTLPVPSTIWMTVAHLTTTEGDDPTPYREWVEIRIDQAIGIDVEFEWDATAGTATGDGDFVTSSGESAIPAGDQNTWLPVDIIGDEVFEGDEQFSVEIRPVTSGVEFTDGNAVSVTIVDDDPEPAPTG